jgi:hypothetical protein
MGNPSDFPEGMGEHHAVGGAGGSWTLRCLTSGVITDLRHDLGVKIVLGVEQAILAGTLPVY